ncbi:CotH kinase family protein [Acinetobacter sp. WU_MDCI_Axc73]|nr:CotH kinase family protein [Acinetobacter sp. WU_MDCI_Axc73]
MQTKKILQSSAMLLPIFFLGCGGGSNGSNNQAPIAIIQTSETNFYNNTQIKLDGSKSFDPDSDTLTYSWGIVEQPANSQISFSDATSALPSFTTNLPGHYTLSLTVSDGKTTSALKTFSLDVLDQDTIVNCDVFAPTNLNIAINEGVEIQKDTYSATVLTVQDINTNITNTLNSQIKGRGNSTWAADKKPYRLKLNTAASLYGMPENQNWDLLANAYDGTMLRNATALCLGKNFIRNSWTANYRFANVSLNGKANGLYLVTEHLDIAPNKVNLGNNNTKKNPDIHEFFVEMTPASRVTDSGIFVQTKYGTYYEVKSDVSSNTTIKNQQLNYISNYLNEVEDRIFNNNFDPNTGYQNYIDIDSAVDYILLNELFKDNDHFWASTNFFKTTDGKLTFGPIWDYDLSAGNYVANNTENPEGWWILTLNYPSHLMQDPIFKQKLIERWAVLYKKMPNLLNYIDREAQNISNSTTQNNNIWPLSPYAINWNAGTPVFLGNDENAQVAYLKSWLTKRAEWMNSQLNP